jgi:hypothetical protein
MKAGEIVEPLPGHSTMILLLQVLQVLQDLQDLQEELVLVPLAS